MIDGLRHGFFGPSDAPTGISLAVVAARAAGLAIASRSCGSNVAGSCAIEDRPVVTPESIRASIAAGLDCAHLRVRGDGQHFEALIVSPEFEGLSRVRRHQRVYAALGERMREEIHALSMSTLTPAEWAQRGE